MTISAEIYHLHPDELTDEQWGYCREYLAKKLVEQDEHEEKYPSKGG